MKLSFNKKEVDVWTFYLYKQPYYIDIKFTHQSILLHKNAKAIKILNRWQTHLWGCWRIIFPSQHSENIAKCSVIKDGGDDIYVTHAKEIGYELIQTSESGIEFLKGQGVGKITLPGLHFFY